MSSLSSENKYLYICFVIPECHCYKHCIFELEFYCTVVLAAMLTHGRWTKPGKKSQQWQRTNCVNVSRLGYFLVWKLKHFDSLGLRYFDKLIESFYTAPDISSPIGTRALPREDTSTAFLVVFISTHRMWSNQLLLLEISLLQYVLILHVVSNTSKVKWESFH